MFVFMINFVGGGFDPHSGRRVVSLSKTHLLSKSTGNKYPGSDMTEKLLTGTLSKNETKNSFVFCLINYAECY